MELSWLDIGKQEREPRVYTLEESVKKVKFACVTAYKAYVVKCPISFGP